jgi:hypothetical protein
MDGRGSGFRARLRDGSDSSGLVAGPSDGGCAWPELARRVEQGAAQVLQEAQAVGGYGEAAPAGRGSVQDRPDQSEAAGLAGEPAGCAERARQPTCLIPGTKPGRMIRHQALPGTGVGPVPESARRRPVSSDACRRL